MENGGSGIRHCLRRTERVGVQVEAIQAARARRAHQLRDRQTTGEDAETVLGRGRSGRILDAPLVEIAAEVGGHVRPVAPGLLTRLTTRS